jgi:cell volume regulation protein A
MDGFAWMSQILLFLTLGLLVNPRELLTVLIPALVIAFFVIFVARPLSIFLSLAPFRNIHFKDKIFVSWLASEEQCRFFFPYCLWLPV